MNVIKKATFVVVMQYVSTFRVATNVTVNKVSEKTGHLVLVDLSELVYFYLMHLKSYSH